MADNKKIAKEPTYHGALVDTMAVQVKIKQVITDDLTAGVSEKKTKAKVKKLIDDFCKGIDDATYRERARRVLVNSFVKWYRQTAKAVAVVPYLVLMQFRNAPQKLKESVTRKATAVSPDALTRIEDITPHPEYGREYHDSDYRKEMKKAFSRLYGRLADNEAKYSKYVSLRNLAEVEVRRREIAQMIEGFRARGITLVWSSSHADASARCAPWQGRLYSLDGTYGSIDGHNYQPIENAINVVDKYGTVNGLFGYNCRHRLIEYTPKSKPPRDYSAEEMRRERAIDQRQRELERTVRKWKVRGYVWQGQNKELSQKAFERADKWTKIYETYSHAHGRAFYRDRIRVMTEEIPYEREKAARQQQNN